MSESPIITKSLCKFTWKDTGKLCDAEASVGDYCDHHHKVNLSKAKRRETLARKLPGDPSVKAKKRMKVPRVVDFESSSIVNDLRQIGSLIKSIKEIQLPAVEPPPSPHEHLEFKYSELPQYTPVWPVRRPFGIHPASYFEDPIEWM